MSSWPKCAKEWETRKRTYWPSQNMIKTIINSGLDVVLIPSKVTVDSDAELKSFRRQ